MRIHAICLAKNESDVIGPCLDEASRWADRIYVYDGASEDGTWELAKERAGPVIVAWRSARSVFREGLRAEVYAAFRDEAQPGDWWCMLDADEFYIDDPRAFLGAVPDGEHVVWGMRAQYYLTPADLEPGALTGEFERDRERLRWFLPNGPEPRFFRHRDRLNWPADDAWPRHAGVVHPRLISLRHYPLRSPAQIQTRLDVRAEHREGGFEGWEHASERDWESMIFPRWQLHEDAGTGNPLSEEALAPVHLESPLRRAVKRAMHGLGLWP